MDIPFNELFNIASFKEYWMEPIGVTFGVTIFGIFFKNVIHKRLKKAVEYSKWQGDDIIIAGSGVLDKTLSDFAIKNNLSDLNFYLVFLEL